MASQWYQLGKELDHRFKIFYRTNSTIDRMIYRFFTGTICMFLLFNFIFLLNESSQKIFFWLFFIIMGIFYSWPTRGKIIEESISQQFREFKFLDSFERNVLTLVVVYFLVSIPELPIFESIEALKLYLDPIGRIHPSLWNYYTVLFLPFKKYPSLLSLSLCLIIYIKGLFISLVCLYALSRYFFARRLSVLSTLVFISSWAFFINVENEFLVVLTSSLPVFIIWSMLWVVTSATYRSGLVFGFCFVWAALLDITNVLFIPFIILMVVFYFKNKTNWFKKQFLKYTLIGLAITVFLIFSTTQPVFDFDNYKLSVFIDELIFIFSKKAFLSLFIVSFVGAILYKLKIIKGKYSMNTVTKRNFQLLLCYVVLVFGFGFFINRTLINNISLFWILILLSLFPIEFIFQNLVRHRSKRNAIFIFYILVALMDSHFEGRFRNISNIFINDLILEEMIK